MENRKALGRGRCGSDYCHVCDLLTSGSGRLKAAFLAPLYLVRF